MRSPTLSARAVAALVLLAPLAACEQDSRSPADPEFIIAGSAVAADDNRALAELRRVTARYHDFEAAEAAGYDTPITPCWAHHTAGAMGYHYAKPALLGDAEVDLLEPETLMYEPQAGGHMRLVGMEYIVLFEQWEAAGHDLNDPDDVPELLGRKFTPHSSLPLYKLHIWLWRDNPAGIFADWNPKVTCQHADETEVF